MFRLLKRLIVLGIIGAVVMKVLDSRSQSSGSTGSTQWPPIKTPAKS